MLRYKPGSFQQAKLTRLPNVIGIIVRNLKRMTFSRYICVLVGKNDLVWLSTDWIDLVLPIDEW